MGDETKKDKYKRLQKAIRNAYLSPINGDMLVKYICTYYTQYGAWEQEDDMQSISHWGMFNV